ncbi:MAG TPA: ABC transporter permease, partial [Burkholderiaceae bacterium]|nr:ABC transporter permease [Burkholderiaceae bacterium]
MRALDRKLARDLRAIWAQVLTIALVIACGTGGFIGSFATHDALTLARDTYYRDNRFADVFAYAKRVPLALESELRLLPDVAQAQVRAVQDALLDLPGVAQPAIGRFIGVAADEFETGLNSLRLRAGRLPLPGERAAA